MTPKQASLCIAVSTKSCAHCAMQQCQLAQQSKAARPVTLRLRLRLAFLLCRPLPVHTTRPSFAHLRQQLVPVEPREQLVQLLQRLGIGQRHAGRHAQAGGGGVLVALQRRAGNLAFTGRGEG